MPFCVVGKHVFIIDLHFGMESMIPTTNRFCMNMEDKTLILKVEILLLATLVRIYENNEKIHWYPLHPKRLGSLGACPQKKFCKSLSLESQKMPLCVVGKFVYMVDFHSGMENMIPPSTMCCTNLKNSSMVLKR